MFADKKVSVLHPSRHRWELLALVLEAHLYFSITAETGQREMVHGKSPQLDKQTFKE